MHVCTGAPSQCSAGAPPCRRGGPARPGRRGLRHERARQPAVSGARWRRRRRGPGQREAQAQRTLVAAAALVEVARGRVVGPGHRHDPVDEHAGLLEHREFVLQPAPCRPRRPRSAGRRWRRGATARWTASASSSSASSSTPTSAARSRDAGAFGSVMRCQLTSWRQHGQTWSARGSSAGAAKPCRVDAQGVAAERERELRRCGAGRGRRAGAQARAWRNRYRRACSWRRQGSGHCWGQ